MSLICPICKLPVVPFGGEDICMEDGHGLGGAEADLIDDGYVAVDVTEDPFSDDFVFWDEVAEKIVEDKAAIEESGT